MKMAQSSKIICNEPVRVSKFVSSECGTDDWSAHRAIGLERDNKIVAGVIYDNYNGINIFAHIAIKGKITRNFLWYMHHYPFMELKVDRVTGLIPSNNKKVIRFVEKLGAHREGTMRNAHPDGDLLVYCLFRKDCKYLGIYKDEN